MSHKHTKHGPQGEHKILDAALRVAALAGWRRFSFSAVAEEADMTLAQVLRHYPDRASVIRTWAKLVDRSMLGDDISLDPRESVRDRLFDLVMRRIDALEPHKDALNALLPTFAGDPALAYAFARSLSKSMSVTLEAAGVDVKGVSGLVQIKGMSGVYMYVLRNWLKDDSPDMGRTMAALDKVLDRVDSIAGTVFRGGCGPFSRHNACYDDDPTPGTVH